MYMKQIYFVILLVVLSFSSCGSKSKNSSGDDECFSDFVANDSESLDDDTDYSSDSFEDEYGEAYIGENEEEQEDETEFFDEQIGPAHVSAVTRNGKSYVVSSDAYGNSGVMYDDANGDTHMTMTDANGNTTTVQTVGDKVYVTDGYGNTYSY